MFDPNVEYNRIPFDYVVNITRTAAQRATTPLTIDADYDFEWNSIVSTQTGIFSVTVKEGGTGRDLSSAQVNNANWSGTAQLPAPLPEPYVLPTSRTLSFDVTNLTGDTNTIQIVLRGYKLQPVASQQPVA